MVKAELVVHWNCPECGHNHSQEIDLGDYSNINYGIQLREQCDNCETRVTVEVY